MDTPPDERLVVLSGIPVVAQGDQRMQQKLCSFLLRKLGERDHTDMAKIYMPINMTTGDSAGIAVVRYPSAAAADAGLNALNGSVLDRGHTMVVERLGTSAVFTALLADGVIDEGSVRDLVAM